MENIENNLTMVEYAEKLNQYIEKQQNLVEKRIADLDNLFSINENFKSNEKKEQINVIPTPPTRSPHLETISENRSNITNQGNADILNENENENDPLTSYIQEQNEIADARRAQLAKVLFPPQNDGDDNNDDFNFDNIDNTTDDDFWGDETINEPWQKVNTPPQSKVPPRPQSHFEKFEDSQNDFKKPEPIYAEKVLDKDEEEFDIEQDYSNSSQPNSLDINENFFETAKNNDFQAIDSTQNDFNNKNDSVSEDNFTFENQVQDDFQNSRTQGFDKPLSAFGDAENEDVANYIVFDQEKLEKVKKILIKHFKFKKDNAEPTAKQILLMDQGFYQSFIKYIDTGIMQNLQVRQYYLYDLITKYNMEIPSAYIMISSLKKDFNKNEEILKQLLNGGK